MYFSCRITTFTIPNSSLNTFVLLCFVDRLLDYMGATSNGVNPLNIAAHISDSPVKVEMYPGGPVLGKVDPAGFNVSIYYCDQSYNDTPACSCQDCGKSCGAPLPPELTAEPEPCLIMGKHVPMYERLRGCGLAWNWPNQSPALSWVIGRCKITITSLLVMAGVFFYGLYIQLGVYILVAS